MLTAKQLVSHALIGSAIVWAPASSAAITVETTDFLTSYNHYNGFEGMGSQLGFPPFTPYTEEGITVTYFGGTGIWTTSQPAAEGQYSWYPNGGSNGYTDVKFNQVINAVEFQAGSGWFNGPVELTYNILLGGSSIATGAISGLPTFSGFNFYGFSGANFDEIQLQGRQGTGNVFDPSAREAGAYDAFKFEGTLSSAPEPASWAMMIAGFGIVGGAMRSSRRNAAVNFG